MENPPIDWTAVLTTLGILIGIAFVLAMLLLAWVVWRVRKINLPPIIGLIASGVLLGPMGLGMMGQDTLINGLAELGITLLLFTIGLDFLSAPFSWVLLGYLGLKPLRGVTVAESLIPGTQFLPTMTTAWVIARLIDPARRRTYFNR